MFNNKRHIISIPAVNTTASFVGTTTTITTTTL